MAAAPRHAGGGSGAVKAPYIVTPLEGIQAASRTGAPRPPSSPCTFLNDTDFYEPGLDRCVPATSPADCCALCNADSTCNAFSFHPGETCAGSTTDPSAPSRCWLKPSATGRRVHQGMTAGTCTALGGPDVFYGGNDPATAGPIAASASVAIVVVATDSQEGVSARRGRAELLARMFPCVPLQSDRTSLDLDPPYDALVAAVAAANPRTVVVVRCPGPCLLPWLDSVPAVVFEGMGGQEAGNALGDVLFAVNGTNPSGKLPLSFPTSMNNTWLASPPGGPLNASLWPGTDRGRGFNETDFSEGLFFGYRWFDANAAFPPLLPFGHGLSYTTFVYSGLTLSVSPAPQAALTASVLVTNTGSVAGREIVQWYVAYPPALAEPPQLLKGWHKTATLLPGESENVTLSLGSRALSVFDVVSDAWEARPGAYELRAAASSRDVRLRAPFTL